MIIFVPMKVGRPSKYKDKEQLQNAIDDYFNNGVKQKAVLIGRPPNQEKVEIPVPTITGLCYYLGYESRQSFYDNESVPEFSYTIKRARLFIEKEYEEQLQVGNTTGAIFALKNMGWTDNKSIDHTTKGERITHPQITVMDKDDANAIKKFYGTDK